MSLSRIVASFIVALPCLVVSAPMPWAVLINENTKQCIDGWFQGDECMQCIIPPGWRSVGHGHIPDVVCPEGYAILDRYDQDCVRSRNEFCCSDGSSGAPGDCRNLAFNEAENKCSFSNCKDLPPDWTRVPPDESYGRCPSGYSWAKDLGCGDPCRRIASCARCILEGCVWSSIGDVCFASCSVSDGNCRRTVSAETTSSGAAHELCREANAFYKDNHACEQATNRRCGDCASTPLPSDASKRCRWVNVCDGDKLDKGCEQCYASACSGHCTEISRRGCPSTLTTTTNLPATTDPAAPTYVRIKGKSSKSGTSRCMKVRGGKARPRNKIVLARCRDRDEAQLFALEPFRSAAEIGADMLWYRVRPAIAPEMLVVGTRAAANRAWLRVEYEEGGREKLETQIFSLSGPPPGPPSRKGGYKLRLGWRPGCAADDSCLYVTNEGVNTDTGDAVMVRTAKELKRFVKHGDVIERWIFEAKE